MGGAKWSNRTDEHKGEGGDNINKTPVLGTSSLESGIDGVNEEIVFFVKEGQGT